MVPKVDNIYTPFAVCVAIQNHSVFDHAGKKFKLFPHCVESLADLRTTFPAMELVVIDGNSTDWPMNQWLARTADRLKHQVINVGPGPFNKGGYLNHAIDAIEQPILLILEADMLVAPELIRVGLNTIIAQDGAFFPHYQRYSPHKWFWGIGTGNVMLSKKVFLAAGGWPEIPKHCDTRFQFEVNKVARIYKQRIHGLIHMWHPQREAQSDGN